MTDLRVGSHFWLSEFLSSDYAARNGIDNTPSATQMANVCNVLAPGMQRVRDTLGAPVMITSGFRSEALNKAIGGSANSQHMDGLAADFRAPSFGTPRTVTQYLMERSGEIRFDQLLLEAGWVHISFVPGEGRSEVLTAHFKGDGTVTYTKGIS